MLKFEARELWNMRSDLHVAPFRSMVEAFGKRKSVVSTTAVDGNQIFQTRTFHTCSNSTSQLSQNEGQVTKANVPIENCLTLEVHVK
jgi:hypothetical protein